MTGAVFAAVLFAALCHATWNVLIKGGPDPLASATLMALGGCVIAIAALPFLPPPAMAAWPYLAASSAIHVFYFGALIEAYRAGDLSQVYPIARGAAPLMTALASALIVGEHLSVPAWIGIGLLAVGVLLLSAGRSLAGINHRAVGFALFTALTICTYSVVDGIGARKSGSPEAYVLWLFVGITITLGSYALACRGPGILTTIAPFWRRGLGGGGLQIASYGIALWAMTVAPIAVVAALRETSVLFGAALALLILKEPVRAGRIAAAVLILGGLVLLRIET